MQGLRKTKSHERTIGTPRILQSNQGWDFLVVNKRGMVAAMEFKSQVGPSFGVKFQTQHTR